MSELQTLLVIAALVFGFEFCRVRARAWRSAYLVFAALVTLRGIRSLALHAATNIAHPPRYDFLCFWLDGRVALQFHNVYQSEFFHVLGDRLAQPADWVREFLDVGFLYPPISIVWFAPLGLFDTPAAAIVAWYSLLFAALAFAAVALWRQFFSASGGSGLLAATALVMAFPATGMDMEPTQTIGLALLFALLFRGDRNAWRAGIWIALALSIKPFLITLLIVPLITRAWRTIGACAATVAGLLAAAFAIVGPAAFETYLRDNPVGRVPGYMYSGIWNQSLLGWILRFSHREPALLVVTHETLYLTVAAIIIAATVALACMVVRVNRDAAISLSLMLGLLVYPQTLYFYSLLLILPLAIVWSQTRTVVKSGLWVALAIGAIAFLVGHHTGSLVYLAICATYVLTVGVAVGPSFAERFSGAPVPLRTVES